MALTSVRRYLLSALAAVSWACGPALAQTYSANLGPMPLDAANKPNLLGRGEATASWDGKTLSVTGNFAGLPSQATQAHLYVGLYIGVPGTEGFDLTVTHRFGSNRAELQRGGCLPNRQALCANRQPEGAHGQSMGLAFAPASRRATRCAATGPLVSSAA
jgi:hypothetical protein